MGWWQSSGGDSTRSAADVEKEKRFACEYLATDGCEIHWDFIRALQASVADTVMFPAQDLLGLGSEARMNLPSTLGGNWLWRLQAGRLSDTIAERLRRMAECYGRVRAA
jgi:4-alpha-glucanotransferase